MPQAAADLPERMRHGWPLNVPDGRHFFGGGAPMTTPDSPAAPLIWLHRSTLEVPKADRFDFWRQFPEGAHMKYPLNSAHGDFYGESAAVAIPDAAAAVALHVDPCVSYFGPDGDDRWVTIGMINAGVMHIRYGRGQVMTFEAGAAPVVLDVSRPMMVCVTRSDLTYLRLPRDMVMAATGGEAVARGAAVRPLAPGVPVTQLVACLQQLGRGYARRELEATGLLQAARALALVALANGRGAGHHWPGVLEDALFQAACYELACGVADPQLTVDVVATRLGCSRAQLYRLFTARGTSVAAHLREIRLQRAAHLLRSWPHALIGTIAMQCGYGGPVAFNKAFRRRWGMTPGDWRHTAQSESGRAVGAGHLLYERRAAGTFLDQSPFARFDALPMGSDASS